MSYDSKSQYFIFNFFQITYCFCFYLRCYKQRSNNKMIYQKTLHQLNTVFPNLNLKKPTKRANVRPLIQQLQCPNMSSNDLSVLRNAQTCIKPLTKLTKIIQMWLKIIQNNQKARQQQQSKPINKAYVQNMQKLLSQSQQITREQDFVIFVQDNGQKFHQNNSSNMGSVKDYKQMYICKQLQFYNTITKISQQQYFRILEQLTQKLNILQQLIQQTSQNLQYLEQFNKTIQGDELFVKKDNMFNKIVNYNLIRSLRLIQNLESLRNVAYYYLQYFTFSIVRMYYLIYLCRKDIQANADNTDYLEQIKIFISEKPEQIFTKLYNQFIIENLIQLHRIQDEVRTKKYKIQMLNLSQVQTITQKVAKIKQKVQGNQNQAIKQPQFLQIYQQIQNLLVEVRKQLTIDPYNQQCLRNRAQLIYYQNQVIKCFVNVPLSENKNNSGFMPVQQGKSQYEKSISQSINSRKYLSLQNSRLSNKSIKEQQKYKQKYLSRDKYENQNRMSLKSNKTINNRYLNQSSDHSEEIFVSFQLNNSIQEVQDKIKNLAANSKLYEAECRHYLELIEPGFGDKMQDAYNFNIHQLNILIEAGSALKPTPKQLQIITLLVRNLIKPQITEQTLLKIYKPKLKLSILKALSEKLIEMLYKNTKILDNAKQMQNLPEKIRQFIQVRNLFLKMVNKNLDKILGIASIVFRLKIEKMFDVCSYQSYETFLKILLAQKQAKTYHLSFQDQKISSKNTRQFINNLIYIPFLQSLKQILPAPYNQPNNIMQILDDIQFFIAFITESQKILQAFVDIIDSQRQKQSLQKIKVELNKQLSKWLVQCPQKLKNKKNILNYTKAEAQITKLQEIIKVCNNYRRSEIKDVVAIKMMNLFNKKI